MNNMRIVFIGSRFNVLEKLLASDKQLIIKIYSLEKSFLSEILDQKKIEYTNFTSKNKKLVLNELLKLEFDILISNGCPIIFPVNQFKKKQLFINVHPTYLPELQGKTPLNGVFYNEHDYYGATMHYIDSGIDTGDIIYQEKKPLTPDIDLGLLYFLAMGLEGTVFEKGWKLLKESDFEYIGKKQKGVSSYFNRTKELQQIDIQKTNMKSLLRTIKSFGIKGQGALATIKGSAYKIYDAEEIINEELLSKFKDQSAGSVLREYDDKILIKTKDGILKINRFERVE